MSSPLLKRLEKLEQHVQRSRGTRFVIARDEADVRTAHQALASSSRARAFDWIIVHNPFPRRADEESVAEQMAPFL
jgi:hypothetical protein